MKCVCGYEKKFENKDDEDFIYSDSSVNYSKGCNSYQRVVF